MCRSLAMALLLAACGAGSERAGAGAADTTLRADTLADSASADSLVVRLPGGTEIWYTLARDARSADGGTCVERGIEIRRGEERSLVPLLYTRDIPEVVDDSTVTTRLYRDCVAGDRYRVNLRTGQPTPIR